MFYMNKEKTGIQHQEKLQNIWTQRDKHIIEWWTGHWRSQEGSWKFGLKKNKESMSQLTKLTKDYLYYETLKRGCRRLYNRYQLNSENHSSIWPTLFEKHQDTELKCKSH